MEPEFQLPKGRNASIPHLSTSESPLDSKMASRNQGNAFVFGNAPPVSRSMNGMTPARNNPNFPSYKYGFGGNDDHGLSPARRHNRLRSRSFDEHELTDGNVRDLSPPNGLTSPTFPGYFPTPAQSAMSPTRPNWDKKPDKDALSSSISSTMPMVDSSLSSTGSSQSSNGRSLEGRFLPFLDMININTASDRGVITSPKPVTHGRNAEAVVADPNTAYNFALENSMMTSSVEEDSDQVSFLQTMKWNGDMRSSGNASKLNHYRHECSQITEWLYVAGENVAKDKKLLTDVGITHIVNCAGTVCQNYHEADGDMRYHTLHITDNPQEDIVCLLYEIHDFIETARAEHPGHKILLHCQLGVSRSTALCIGYLMLLYNKDYEEVHSMVREKRGITRPNVGFICQLLSWRKRILRAQETHTTEWLGLYRMAPHNRMASDKLVSKWAEPIARSTLDDRGIFICVTTSRIYVWVGALVYRTLNNVFLPGMTNTNRPLDLSVAVHRVKQVVGHLQRFEHAPDTVTVILNSANNKTQDHIAFEQILSSAEGKSTLMQTSSSSLPFLYNKAYDDDYGALSMYVNEQGQVHDYVAAMQVRPDDMRIFADNASPNA